MPTPCRLVEPVGHTYHAGWHWEDGADHEHRSEVEIDEATYSLGLDGVHAKLRAEGRVAPCETCGRMPPEDLPFGQWMGCRKVWGTEDGKLHPGDMFWAPWLHHDGKCLYWDNCDDPRGHLIVVLPNGHQWDVDSRASNCTMPEDRTHRCWVRTGEPPNVTAGKSGHTCAAGAGSILSGDYHGFLQNGVLT